VNRTMKLTAAILSLCSFSYSGSSLAAVVEANEDDNIGNIIPASGDLNKEIRGNRTSELNIIVRDTGEEVVSLPNNSLSLGSGSVTGNGDGTLNVNVGNTAIGINSEATGYGAVSLGAASTAIQSSTAIGTMSAAESGSVANGRNSAAKDESVAMGNNSESKNSSVSIGNNSESKNSSIAIGHDSHATGNNSIAIGKDSIAKTDNTVSFGNDTTTRLLTNISEGSINEKSKDAINGSQLYQVKEQTEKNINDARQEAIKSSNSYTDVKIDNNNTVINSSINDARQEAIKSSNSYTDVKIDSNNTVINSNINDARQEAIKSSNSYTDNRLSTYSNESLNQANNYTNDRINNNNSVLNNNINDAKQEAIKSSNSYTNDKLNNLSSNMNSRFKSLDEKINKNTDRANAGIASVSAMSNIPYTNHTTFSSGLGVGNYRNGNAIAVGSQLKINDNVNFRTSISWNNKDSAVIGAGVAIGY